MTALPAMEATRSTVRDSPSSRCSHVRITACTVFGSGSLSSRRPRDQVAHDWAAGASYGAMWRPKIVTAKHRAVTATSRVADLALDVTGGVGIFPSSGLERPIPGCAARADPLSHRFLTREIVVKAALGLDLDEQPRSG